MQNYILVCEIVPSIGHLLNCMDTDTSLFVFFRGNKIICSHREEFHRQDVHLPVLHLFLLTVLRRFFSRQVRTSELN